MEAWCNILQDTDIAADTDSTRGKYELLKCI